MYVIDLLQSIRSLSSILTFPLYRLNFKQSPILKFRIITHYHHHLSAVPLSYTTLSHFSVNLIHDLIARLSNCGTHPKFHQLLIVSAVALVVCQTMMTTCQSGGGQ